MTAQQETLESLELVRHAQGGDLDAFDRLFERYYRRVFALVRLRLGSGLRRELDSSDIVHEVLIDAIRGFDRFEVRDRGSLIHWLAQIVESRIRRTARHARAQKRDRAGELALDHVRSSFASGSLRLEAADSGPGVSDVVAGREEEALVELALEDLQEDHREVVLLRHYADASWPEIAELVDRPSPDAARMLYGRALIELRKAVDRRRDDNDR